ncbi:MAG: tetratricopeptide repeat protein, partial [Steroidobacteraceae bacterium]
RYQDEARLIGDVASRQRFADELIRQGRSPEAIGIYRQTLSGLYEHDPNLLLGLARAQFASGAFSEARSTLDASCAPAVAETTSNAVRTTILAIRMHRSRPMEPRRRS